MKRLLLLGLCLSACAPEVVVKPYGSDVLPLDANGLPPYYSRCVRNRTVNSAAIYDVYYGCRRELTSYVSGLNGVPQEQKAAMVEDMETKAIDYAHKTVVDWHGADAVRRTIDPSFPPERRSINRPLPPE